MAVSWLSGNEIYCLDKINLTPGNLLVGNSVHSMGIIRSLGSSIKAVVGGEVRAFTELIEDGRRTAYAKMVTELKSHGGYGVTWVSSEIIFHGGNIEFLSIGSAIHSKTEGAAEDGKPHFSSSSNAQELYAQVDAWYKPLGFVFGNVAYSIGIAKWLIGTFRSLRRGEVKEFSWIFNKTRNLALERIVADASKVNANAVIWIETTILPIGVSGVQEMLMIGTAAYNEHIPKIAGNEIVTSDLTAQEMWGLTNMGYAPMRLVLGTSVYSLWFIWGITSFFKSFVKWEIPELTKMIYDAREESLWIIQREAQELWADDVVGVKTYVYELGGGLIEFLAIGTAIKKIPWVKTKTDTLLTQAIVSDKDTFVNSFDDAVWVSLNQTWRETSWNFNKKWVGIVGGITLLLYVVAVIVWAFTGK